MEDNIITLTDENGAEQKFEFLHAMEYEGTEYLFLLPVDADPPEVVILEIEPVDEETENYVSIEDEDLLETLFNLFKQEFAEEFNFVD